MFSMSRIAKAVQKKAAIPAYRMSGGRSSRLRPKILVVKISSWEIQARQYMNAVIWRTTLVRGDKIGDMITMCLVLFLVWLG